VPEKDPLFSQIISEWASIIYVVLISSAAGAVGYLNKIRNNTESFSWVHIAINFFIGGLNGYLVFLLCDAAGWSWQLTAFLSGASGAMGGEMLNTIMDKAKKVVSITVKEGK